MAPFDPDTAAALATASWLGLIPFFPLWGALVLVILGPWLAGRGRTEVIAGLAVGVTAASSLLGLLALGRVWQSAPEARLLVDPLFTLLEVGRLRVDLSLAVDPLAAVMVVLVTFAGTLVLIYSAAYPPGASLSGEGAYWRYFATLNLLVAATLLLVMAANLVTLFIGWQGIGIASWLFVGFQYQQRPPTLAGLKSLIVQVVGDAGFLVGLVLLFFTENEAGLLPTFDLHALERAVGASDHTAAWALLQPKLGSVDALTLTTLAFAFAACGKSAQLPLSVWLPDATFAPTPAAALIHAATLMTAGVYLLTRLDFLLVLTPTTLSVVALVGLLTALTAATIAPFQYDLKRLLAYATMAELGLMFIGIGVGAPEASTFHLVSHVCFTTCLFLGAGALIHALRTAGQERPGSRFADTDETAPRRLDARALPDPADARDLRNFGDIGAALPRTALSYFVACAAMAGLPCAAGFFSTGEILNHALVRRPYIFVLALVAVLLISFSLFRTYYLVFAGRTSPRDPRQPPELPGAMTSVLTVLTGLCLVIGPTLAVPAWLAGTTPLSTWLDPSVGFAHSVMPTIPTRGMRLFSTLALLAASTLGWSGARALFRDLAAHDPRTNALRSRFEQLPLLGLGQPRLDRLYELTLVRGTAALGRLCAFFDAHVIEALTATVAAIGRTAAFVADWADRLVVDGAVEQVARLVLTGGRSTRRLQTGRINDYLLAAIAGIVLLMLLARWL